NNENMDNSKKASSSDKPSAAAGNQGDQSNYRIAKDGWGSRSTFQHSYNLPRTCLSCLGIPFYDQVRLPTRNLLVTPEGFIEGNQILDAFREHDRQMAAEDAKEAAQAEKGGK